MNFSAVDHLLLPFRTIPSLDLRHHSGVRRRAKIQSHLAPFACVCVCVLHSATGFSCSPQLHTPFQSPRAQRVEPTAFVRMASGGGAGILGFECVIFPDFCNKLACTSMHVCVRE